MPGQVPLNNAKFENAPDFNNQAITGITGLGVFRQFEYSNIVGTSRTLVNGDLWKMLQFTGNCLITIPSGLSANVGDEILVVNTTGTISFVTTAGATLLSSSTLYALPASRPARLVYNGSDTWILAGAKTQYSLSLVYDCCGEPQASLFTLNAWPEGPAYSNKYGTSLYNYTGVGSVAVVDSNAYTINNGAISESECLLTNFTNSYTFYDEFFTSHDFYTYDVIDIFDDAQILGVPFKTTATSDVYACDTTNAVPNGTWYRNYDMYGTTDPVCFSNGIVVDTNPC